MHVPDVAVALRYDAASERLPYVAAKGRGLVAERIRALAAEHSVPIHADPELVRILDGLDAGAPIPTAAFAAVAEILAHLYRLNRRLADTAPEHEASR